jgi:ketosteroid isomerase-like protein
MVIRRTGWLLAGMLIFPILLSAQVSAKQRAIATELEMGAEEIVVLEKETAHALALNNASFFQRVYSDDYAGTAPSGEILDRSRLVKSIQSSAIKYSSFIATDIHVRLFGPTAVVTCIWSTRGVQDGRNFSKQYRVIHVYLYNVVSGWKVVAGQETVLPG